MLADPSDGRPTRVRIESEGAQRYRVTTRSGTKID
jgi:hypothetical protein